MNDWTNGVERGIAEMIGEKDKHNALILSIDSFLKVVEETGFVDLVVTQIEKVRERLRNDIIELNKQIEKQKA